MGAHSYPERSISALMTIGIYAADIVFTTQQALARSSGVFTIKPPCSIALSMISALASSGISPQFLDCIQPSRSGYFLRSSSDACDTFSSRTMRL